MSQVSKKSEEKNLETKENLCEIADEEKEILVIGLVRHSLIVNLKDL